MKSTQAEIAGGMPRVTQLRKLIKWPFKRVDQGLDHGETFRRAFATLLPRLRAGDISQGKAAKELGISVRSLKRYVAQAAEMKPMTDHLRIRKTEASLPSL